MLPKKCGFMSEDDISEAVDETRIDIENNVKIPRNFDNFN